MVVMDQRATTSTATATATRTLRRKERKGARMEPALAPALAPVIVLGTFYPRYPVKDRPPLKLEPYSDNNPDYWEYRTPCANRDAAFHDQHYDGWHRDRSCAPRYGHGCWTLLWSNIYSTEIRVPLTRRRPIKYRYITPEDSTVVLINDDVVEHRISRDFVKVALGTTLRRHFLRLFLDPHTFKPTHELVAAWRQQLTQGEQGEAQGPY